MGRVPTDAYARFYCEEEEEEEISISGVYKSIGKAHVAMRDMSPEQRAAVQALVESLTGIIGDHDS